MSDWTPDEDDIRAVWRGHWDPESIPGKNADAEIDRCLNHVRAIACREGAMHVYVAEMGQLLPPTYVQDNPYEED